MKRVFAFPFLLIVVLATAAGAQLRIGHDSTAPGGVSTSGNQKLYDTVGQAFAGASTNNTHIHSAGFQYIVRNMLARFPTAVLFGPLRAQVSGRSVEITWEVLRADGLQGFRVYRSDPEGDTFSPLAGADLPPGDRASFRDDAVAPGQTYRYRVSAVDADGVFVSPVLTVTTPAWHTELQQNYPNPFNPGTTISFYVAQPTQVALAVFDARGGLVRTLLRERRETGLHQVEWDGTSDNGTSVSSGVYFYRLRANGRTFARKMLMLK